MVFDGLSGWLRAGQLSPDTLKDLYASLLTQLADTGDPNGFQQPFAALVLSEVARTDRIDPWMTPAVRGRTGRTAARYLATVSDYRGFSETEGWRHGVAHGSDLVLQLVLNPNIDAGQIDADECGGGPGGPAGRSVLFTANRAGWRGRYFMPTRAVCRRDCVGGLVRADFQPNAAGSWSAAYASQAGWQNVTIPWIPDGHAPERRALPEGEQADLLDALVKQATTRVLGG